MASKEQQLPFGKIEPNSSKYFLSCALGGIVGKILHPSYSALGVMLTQRFSHLKHVDLRIQQLHPSTWSNVVAR
ncbi:Cu/Pi carrier [Aspergillus fumigatus]